MSRFKAIIISIIVLTFISCPAFAQQKINWNGYFQYRFSENYSHQTGFSIRRAKLWMNGQLPVESDKWGFKLQTIFLNKQNFRLELLDAYIDYKVKGFTFLAGQFVPNFSLQRKQADYRIPLNERANVINALIPTAETASRDIGIEIKREGRIGGMSIGIFNGNGANTLSNDMHILFVNRGFLRFKRHKKSFQIGYSFSYHKDEQLTLKKILGNTTTFTGDDFRYGLDLQVLLPKFEFQSEYLQAILKHQKAWGYYALTDYEIISKNRVILSMEQLSDRNPQTMDRPWYILGYSYQLKGYDIKFTLDNRLQFCRTKTNSMTTLQVQYFFNQ